MVLPPLLANRHRLDFFSRRLRDGHFRLYDSFAYAGIRELRSFVLRNKEAELGGIIAFLHRLLQGKNIVFVDIHGRIKGVYSTYRKMLKYDMDLSCIHDLVAVRIIVENRHMCYTTLAAVHETFKPLPGRFKDYITTPKSNGYKSLHTSVSTPKGTIFEVQIRTPHMHEIAEFGSAAHWFYDLVKNKKLQTPLPPEKSIPAVLESQIRRPEKTATARCLGKEPALPPAVIYEGSSNPACRNLS